MFRAPAAGGTTLFELALPASLVVLGLLVAVPVSAAVGDQDGDTDIDVDDINIILAARNMPAVPGPPADPRDLDSDGVITVLDARIAASCCTRPLCATGNNPPSITSPAAVSAPENQTTAANVDSTDPDGETEGGGGLTYSLTGGADQLLFTIDPNSGVLTFSVAPDFEAPGDANADNVYEVDVTVTDSGPATDILSMLIAVTNVNEGPSITSGGGGASASVNAVENQTAVTDVQSTDPDGETEGGGGLTYSLTGGADIALFSVDLNSGVLTFNTAPDFESPSDTNGDNVYEVQVTVTDGGGLTDSQDITATVTDANDPPTITSDGGGATASVSAAENQTAVTDVQSTDQDGDTEGAGLTYTLTGGADQGLFSIVAGTGVLTFSSAPDFDVPGDANGDNDYEVQVTVTDSGTLTDVQDLTVTVTDVNEAPTITSSATPSVPENTTAVIDVQSTDPEGDTEGAGLTYTITGGADSGLFSIVAGTGVLTFNAAPDFENPGDANTDNVYEVQVTVTDSGALTDVQDLTVTVTDVNEAPTITSSATPSVPENTTAVIDVQSTDPEGDTEGAGLTYTITGGADSGLFSIVAGTGVLTFNAAPDFENPGDANTDNVYEVQVTVTDSGALTDVQDLTVTVTDVNEVPTITSSATPSVPENTTAVIDVQSTDPEGDTEGAGLTYTITGGADSVLFSIVAGTGVLTFNAAPDFENPGDANADNVYEVQVTVTDSGALTDVQNLQVTVTDVNEPPMITTNPVAYVTAGNTQLKGGSAAMTTAVAYVEDASNIPAKATVVDPEMAALTFSLFSGPTNGTATVSAAGNFLYNSNPGYVGPDSFDYQVFDGVNTLTGTVDVTVTDTDGVVAGNQVIWYVENDAAAGGNGTSGSPFDTLKDAESMNVGLGASDVGDTIFLLEGDTTTTSQDAGLVLDDDQNLIGHAAATLVANGVTIQTPSPGGRPKIEHASGGDGVELTDRSGVEIRNLDITGDVHGIDVTATTGTPSVVIDNNVLTGSAGGHGVNVVASGTASPAVDFSNNTVESTDASFRGAHIDGSASSGTLSVTGFANNSVNDTASMVGAGVRVAGATFDADTGTAGIQQVAAGTLTVGDSGGANRTMSAGLLLDTVRGNLAFTSVDVFNSNGTGIELNNAALAAADFTLAIGGGTIDTVDGSALDLDPATVDVMLASVTTSTAVAGFGASSVRLVDLVNGPGGVGVDINGGALAGSTAAIFVVGDGSAGSGGTATIAYDGTMADGGATSVVVQDRAAGANNVTFAGAIGTMASPVGGTIVADDNAAGSITFSGPVELSTGANGGVSLTANTGATVNFIGDLDIATTTGSGFVATGGGTVNVTGANTSVTVGAAPHAVDLSGVTIGAGDITFDTIDATGTTSNAIDVDGVSNAGTFIGGATTINGTTAGSCIDIAGATSADFTFSSLTIDDCAAQGVHLASTNASGDFSVAGTTNLGATIGNTGQDIDIDNMGGSVTFNAVNIDNRGAEGIAINGTGGTIQFGATTIDNQGSDATDGIDIAGTTGGSITFSSLALDNNGVVANGVDLTGNAATVDIQNAGSSITGSGGAALRVNGGAASADYDGTITNTAGRSVDVQNRTGGTVTVAGNVDDDGTGIFLDSNGAGTVTFRGGMALDTGATTAFTATGGGTVEVCATADCAAGAAVVNTIGAGTALTGTAVNVANTTLGANGVTFQSISVNGGGGASTAIILDNSGAGDFSVTGVNGPCGNTAMPLDCDGGTIENINADAITLNNNDGLVTLANMLIEDIGATGGPARSQHDAIHGATVDGGLTIDSVIIRRISDQGINGAVFTGPNAGVAATTWTGLRILDSLIENTNRYHVANTLDNLDEGCVRINGLNGTVEIDNSVIQRGGRLFEAFTTPAGNLNMTVQRSSFSLSYKETATVIANLGMRVQVEGTTDAVIKVGDPQETVNPALGNSFLNIGLDALLIQGGIGASGTVDVLVAQNTFTTNDHDAPIACCSFPQGGVVLSPQVGDFDAIFAQNTFTNVANAGGRDANLAIVADRGSGEIIVRNNTFNAPFNGTWEVLSDGFNDPTVNLNVLFDSNTYITDPAFFSPDVGIAFHAPGFHSDAFARNGGTLTLTIQNENVAAHETRPGLCIACANGTLIFEAQASGGTFNLFLNNVDAPNGFDLTHSGGTFNLFRGASAAGTPQTVLNNNANTGGDPPAPPGINVYPGTPGLSPPEVTVGGLIGSITSVAGTPTLPNPTIP